MMKRLFQYITIISIVIIICSINIVHCKSIHVINPPSSSSSSSSSEIFDIYHHLSTKTPYWIPDESKGSPSPPPQCTLQRIDMLARHGSRMPVENDIYEIIDLIQVIKQYADSISPQYQWILNWTVPYPTTESGFLIFQGELEHYQLAKRMLSRFPDNFPSYSPSVYNTSCTTTSRTCISANSFLFGAFEGAGGLGPSGYQPTFTWTSSPNEDYLLRFFDNCQNYQNQPANSQKSLYQSATYPNISVKVATLLGLQDKFDISLSAISTMFSICSYEISINNITNQWCSLFDQSDIETWEYASDLDDYWTKGYGVPINYQISSLLLRDMISYFDQFIDDPTNLNNTNVLRFAHAETVIPFVSLLGLYKDDYELTSQLDQQQIDNRKFRTSVISPYAANVALLFYDCGNNSYKLRVDHNEIATFIPGCDDIYCDYTIFKQVFKDALTTFNWDSTCGTDYQDVLYRSDKEWKILMSIFIPFAAIIGLLLGLFLPALFRKVRTTGEPNGYKSLNGNAGSGLVYH